MEKSSFVVRQNNKITEYFFPFFFYTLLSFFPLLAWNFLSTKGIISFKRRNIPKAEHEISPATEVTPAGAPGPREHCCWCADMAPSVSKGRLHSIPRREYKTIWLMALVQARKVQRLDLLLIFLQTVEQPIVYLSLLQEQLFQLLS